MAVLNFPILKDDEIIDSGFPGSDDPVALSQTAREVSLPDKTDQHDYAPESADTITAEADNRTTETFGHKFEAGAYGIFGGDTVVYPGSSGHGSRSAERRTRAGVRAAQLPIPQSYFDNNIELVAKRIFDLVISISALMVLAPVLLAIALLIRVESRGPVLFRQRRWGRGLVPFVALKFRTMYIDQCDATGVNQTKRNDPRCTRVGTFLRRYNLDELPQLWNVFVGNMSLVGPRCHPIGMLAGGLPYEELVPEYHARHAVLPGLTGLAQAHGLRGPTDDAAAAIKRVKYDLFYIRNFSFWLDLKIIAMTVVSELRGGKGF